MRTIFRLASITVLIASSVLFFRCSKESSPSQPTETTPSVLQDQTKIADAFEQYLASQPLDTAIERTARWSQQQPYVKSVEKLWNGLSIEYSSGLRGGVVIYTADSAGHVDIGGRAGPPEIKKQGIRARRGVLNDKIGNRKVLIWSPFDDMLTSPLRREVSELVNGSDFTLELTALTDESCTVRSFETSTYYGMVILYTHGYGGKYIMTREEVTDEKSALYAGMLQEGKIETWTAMVRDKDGDTTRKSNVYMISDKLVSALQGAYPNSLVFNASCEGTKAGFLGNAFLGKGAKTYFGFSGVTNSVFATQMAQQIVWGVAGLSANTGQSFIPNQEDPRHSGTKFEMKGSTDLAYARPRWVGTFQYMQSIHKEFTEANETRKYDIDVKVDFQLTLSRDDTLPILFYPVVFSKDSVKAPYTIDYALRRTTPSGTITCMAHCSDSTVVTGTFGRAWLDIYPDSAKYTLHIGILINQLCVVSCSGGSFYDLPIITFYGHPGNWDPQIPYPLKGAMADSATVSGNWTSPGADTEGDCGVDELKGVTLTWNLVKVD